MAGLYPDDTKRVLKLYVKMLKKIDALNVDFSKLEKPAGFPDPPSGLQDLVSEV